MLDIQSWSLKSGIIANIPQTVFTDFRMNLKILAIPHFLHLTKILKLKNAWYNFLHLA